MFVVWNIDNVRPCYYQRDYFWGATWWKILGFLWSLLISVNERIHRVAPPVCLHMNILCLGESGKKKGSGPPSRVDCLQLLSCLSGCCCCRSWDYYLTEYTQWAVNSLVGVCLKCLHPCPICGYMAWNGRWLNCDSQKCSNDYKWVIIKGLGMILSNITFRSSMLFFSCFIFSGLSNRTMQFAHQVLCSYGYSVFEKLPQQGLSRSVLQCAIC